MSKWISVKDRLPPEEKNVLFYVSLYSIIRVGYIIPKINRGEVAHNIPAFWFVDDSENTAYAEEDVTHWQELPAPPENEE